MPGRPERGLRWAILSRIPLVQGGTMVAMDELTAFMRACLDSQEARADAVLSPPPGYYDKSWQADQLREQAEWMLDDVAAKRKILNLHASVPSGYVAGQYVGQGGDLQCSHCAALCHSSSGLRCEEPDAPWPCETVILLAQAYAGQPGWREEWRA